MSLLTLLVCLSGGDTTIIIVTKLDNVINAATLRLAGQGTQYFVGQMLRNCDENTADVITICKLQCICVFNSKFKIIKNTKWPFRYFREKNASNVLERFALREKSTFIMYIKGPLFSAAQRMDICYGRVYLSVCLSVTR